MENGELIDFRGYWLGSELLRQGKKLRELERANPLLAARNRALDALECDGVDPRDRKAVKRTLGQHRCVPDFCRGNRAAYEAFIDCVIETHTKFWASRGWLLEREGTPRCRMEANQTRRESATQMQKTTRNYKRDYRRQYQLAKQRWHWQAVRLDHEDAAMLKAIAKHRGISKVELIRTYIAWGLMWRTNDSARRAGDL